MLGPFKSKMNISMYCMKLLCKNTTSGILITLRNASAKPLRNTKPAAFIRRKKFFTDYCKVRTVGGDGGDGMVCFLRLYMNPKAGPSGGDGGNGGHVIFRANKNVKCLGEIDSVIQAERGENGRSKSMHGASANHRMVNVPVGTIVKKDEEIMCDLSEHDSRFIAARGGAGGHGNHFFLCDKSRFPEVAECGGKGEEFDYHLELSVMAHVGLVGFPNAGKSTLLRAISRARPKVASYPFTTLNPHIGIVQYDDYVQIGVADLPGLIPGAHENRGLGISFLKHIERCMCILFVIDLSVDCPWTQFECLNYELEQYQNGLSTKPHALVANKYDLPGAEEKLRLLKEKVALPIYPISAKFGNNVRSLLDHVRFLYDEHNKELVL